MYNTNQLTCSAGHAKDRNTPCKLLWFTSHDHTQILSIILGIQLFLGICHYPNALNSVLVCSSSCVCNLVEFCRTVCIDIILLLKVAIVDS